MAIAYFLFGTAWILVSDRVAAGLGLDSGKEQLWVQSLKGEAFVLGTTLLLWAVVHAWARRWAEANAALEQQARWEREYFIANPHPMWVFDRQTRRMLDVNGAALALYGYRREQFLGMSLDELAGQGRDPSIPDAPDPAGMITHRHADGSPLVLSASGRDVVRDGRTVRLVALHDLTRLHRAERERAEAEATFREVLAGLDDITWLADLRTGRVAYVSPAAQRISGIPPERLAQDPQRWVRLIHPEDVVRHHEREQRLAAGEDVDIEYRLLRPDGRVVWVRDRTRVLRDEGGIPARIVGIVTDITAHRLAEEAARLADRVLAGMREGIVVTDANEHIVRVNPAVTRVTGYSESELIGASPRTFSSTWQDAAFYERMWKALREQGRWEGEIWNRRRDGEVYPEWLAISALTDERGQVCHYVGIFTDLTDRKRAEAEVDRLACFDPVTGLPNRTRAFLSIELCVAASRRSGLPGLLFAVDIDGFKKVNDALGHSAGDLVLREFANRLSPAVSVPNLSFRGLGTTILVLVPVAHPGVEAAGIARALLEAARIPVHHEHQELRLTASVGAVAFPAGGSSADELVRRVESGLYRAKGHGGDDWCELVPEVVGLAD